MCNGRDMGEITKKNRCLIRCYYTPGARDVYALSHLIAITPLADDLLYPPTAYREAQ